MAFPDATLQAKVDQVLQDVLDQLAVSQPAILTAKQAGYWQGLQTHATPPADGEEMAPDAAASKPAGGTSWVDEKISLPAAMPVAATVDVYDGPAGRGYVAHADVVVKGVRWRRSVNVGPERHRDAAWRAVLPPGSR